MADYTIGENVTSKGIILKENDFMNVTSKGKASNTTVSSGGTMRIELGGSANITTVSAGGSMYIVPGGKASNTTVNNGGLYQAIGGSAISTTINSGGELQLMNGGYAYKTEVNSDGKFYVPGGNSAMTVTVHKGGLVYVANGGILFGTMKFDAGAIVSANEGSIIDFNLSLINLTNGVSVAVALSDISIVQGAPAYTLTVDGYQAYGIYRLIGNAAGFDKTITVKNKQGEDVGTLTLEDNSLVLVDRKYILSINASSELVVTVSNVYDLYGRLEWTADLTTGMIASGVRVCSGGRLNVLNGGSASMTSIASNGLMYVSDGGFASKTSIDDGIMHVSNGGSASMTTIYGIMHVSDGGKADGVTVGYGGKLNVSAGGTVNTTTISSQGSMYVSDGGKADDVTVGHRAYLYVSSGGTATQILENGGCVNVDNGATVTFLPNSFGGYTYTFVSATIHSGNTGTNLSANEWGKIYVIGGTAENTSVGSSGYLYVSSGGVANGATVKAYGGLEIHDGGKLTGKMSFEGNAVVSAYEGSIIDFDISGVSPNNDPFVNNLSLVQGAPAYTLTVSGSEATGDYKLAEGAAGFDKTITVKNTSGTTLGTLTVGGDTQTLGGRDYTLTLTDGGALGVTVAGDVIADTTPPVVFNIKADITGPTNQNVTVTADFDDDVALASKQYRIGTGDWQDYPDGGVTVTTNATVSFKATDTAGNETTASYEVTNIIPPVAPDLTGDLSSSFTLTSDMVASSVNILEKGKLFVRNGGIAEVTTVNSRGELHVSSGGSADGVTVNSGGSLGVYIGGSATGIVAEEGAYYCFMAAPNTYIKGTYAGSAFEIAGTARGFAIQSGCELYVWFGGSASNTTVTNGGNLCIDEKGSATGVTVTSGGSAMVLYGASAAGIVAEDGAHLTMMVASDTYAQGTYAGSAFEINDTVSGYTLHGLLAVTFGGTVDDVTVNPGCELIVHADGTATNIKENGGFVEFEEGATVSFVSNTFSGVHVSGANSASVHSGTTAADTTVSDGGNLFVVGGVADGITVANDGVLYLYGGKVTGKMTFGTYAQVFAYTGAILDFDLTQTTAGADALVNDLAPALATDFDYMLTVSGSEAAGNYKLAGNAAGFDKTITVVNTSGTTLGTLTVGGDTLFTKSSGYTLTLGADNTLSVDITTKSVSVDDTTPPVISNVAANITTMTLGSVTVTADFDDDVALASKQYRIGAGDWQDYTTGVTVTTNTTVYFKAVDTAGNETTASYVVTNIIPPVAPDLSGDLTASYDLTAGMVGHDVNILNGGELNVSDGGTVENTTVNNGGELNVSSGGKLTGKMTFENGATVTAETGAVFDFDLTQTTPGADALVNDLSFVKDQPFTYTLTVDDKVDLGTYKLAGNATGFDKPITVKSTYGETACTLTVEDGTTKVGEAYLTLALSGSDLFFRVSDKGDAIVPDNKPDDGKNDYLWTKKLGWNDANILVTNTIRGNGEIDIDALGTIDTDDGYHNMFGNDGTNKDTGDVAKIGVKTAAKLTFTIDSNAAGTFYVYEDGFDKKGKRNQITVGKVSVKAGQTAMLKDVCLTATGNYYVAMTAKNVKKAGAEGLYNVNVTESKFFRDADDGSNNTAKDNYLTWAERGVKSIDLENELMTDSAVFNNFVGFADNADYIKLVLPKSAYMKFSLTGEGDGTAKFTIWKQDNATGKMSKVTNVSLPAKKAYDATTKAQFLDVNGGRYEYYISMECSDAAKGKGVYYNVQIADDTVFFDSADDGRNDVLYDKKAKAFYAEDGEHHFETTNVGGGTKTVKLDSDPVGDTDYENFVGYGDAADYAKIKLTTSGDLYFKLRASGNATFTIYEKSQDKKGNDTLKAIQTTKLTLAKGKTTVEATTDLIADLAAGEYYVSMTAKSTKANASGSVFYNVTANLNPSVASALEMPMAAAAYADSMQDKLFGESGNGLLASL